MIERSEFFEHAHVHGNHYGTSRKAIEDRIQSGEDIVLEIDWQGALQIQRQFPDAVLVFVLPPSWEELRARLQRRGEDTPEVIELRLVNAQQELAQVKHFDYVIINEDLPAALEDLVAVVRASRLRYANQEARQPEFFHYLEQD